MVYHNQTKEYVFHGQVHNLMRLVQRFDTMTKLAIQLQNWLNWNINGHQNMTYDNK